MIGWNPSALWIRVNKAVVLYHLTVRSAVIVVSHHVAKVSWMIGQIRFINIEGTVHLLKSLLHGRAWILLFLAHLC